MWWSQSEFWTVTTLPACLLKHPHTLYTSFLSGHMLQWSSWPSCTDVMWYLVEKGWLVCWWESWDFVNWPIYRGSKALLPAYHHTSACINIPSSNVCLLQFITITCRIVHFVCKTKLFILSSHASCHDLRCCPKFQTFQSLQTSGPVCCFPSLWGVTVFYSWELKDGSHWPVLACVFNRSCCVGWNGWVEMTECHVSVGKRPERVITHIELLVIALELLWISLFCSSLSFPFLLS